MKLKMTIGEKTATAILYDNPVKDCKVFCSDLKEVYAAPTREGAEQALVGFALKWEHKYKHAIQLKYCEELASL